MHFFVIVPVQALTRIAGWAVIAGLVFLAVHGWLVPYWEFLQGR